jgi:CHRD domain-containing protein
MRRNRVLLFLVAAAALFISSPATAALIELGANLDPFQEVPPHNTPGYGSADATLDTVTGVFTISGAGLYADLLAGATTVRMQDAAVGANGPTIGLLNLDTPGNTSGTFSGALSATLTAGQITDAIAGNTYLNIADSVFPSGEIRGQLLVTTPEPGSIVLASLAAIGLLVAAGRRPRKAA